jgi:hypothetical protein
MQERRRHPRIPSDNKVAVKVLAAPETPDLQNRTFFCTTADISRSGLRFCADVPVPVDTTLELRVSFARPLRAFVHVGQAVWVREEKLNDGARYAVGVTFTNTATPTHIEWKALLARMQEQANA